MCLVFRMVLHPRRLVGAFRYARGQAAANPIGSVCGPVIAVNGRHGAAPARGAVGMRWVITESASASSILAKWVPRQ